MNLQCYSIFFFNASLYFLKTVTNALQSAFAFTLKCVIPGPCLALSIVFCHVPLLLQIYQVCFAAFAVVPQTAH